MPKRDLKSKLRTPGRKKSKEEEFIAEIDEENSDDEPLDPNAPRKFKSIAVPFNEYEFKKLELVSQRTGRPKNNLIRYLILECARKLEREENNTI